MTVGIISSAVIGSSQVSDSLTGGGSGYQFGSVEAGQTQAAKRIWVRHDGVNRISNLSVYLKAYSQAYGGEYSASADLVKALDQGEIGAGFQIDFDWDGVDFAAYTVLKYGMGASPETAIEIPITAILFNNAGIATAASAPEQGELGWSGNSSLGDTVLLKTRWLVPVGELAPGKRQIDLAYIYNFTT